MITTVPSTGGTILILPPRARKRKSSHSLALPTTTSLLVTLLAATEKASPSTIAFKAELVDVGEYSLRRCQGGKAALLSNGERSDYVIDVPTNG